MLRLTPLFEDKEVICVVIYSRVWCFGNSSICKPHNKFLCRYVQAKAVVQRTPLKLFLENTRDRVLLQQGCDH